MALSSYRSLIQSAAPSAAIMTADEAKTHMHITQDAEDTLIEQMIETAETHIREVTGEQLINATYIMKMDSFPGIDGEIIIPVRPLSSVTSVAYVDANGDAQTLTVTTDYIVDTSANPPTIYLAPNATWPQTYGEPNDVTVTFVAGYGAASTSIPDKFLSAAKLIVGHLYLHREQFETEGKMIEYPTVDRLLRNSKIEYVF